MKYFESACQLLSISLYVLPPYSPKYNGRIERSNRIMREEFYNNNKDLINYCNCIGEFNIESEKAIYKYNNYRPHETLDHLTPTEYYAHIINAGTIFPKCVWSCTRLKNLHLENK
jgi:transposase InsO family protein